MMATSRIQDLDLESDSPSSMDYESGGALIEGGFDEDIFLDQLPSDNDRHICRYCLKVIRNPQQRMCGHLFCKLCLAKLKTQAMTSMEAVYCPHCVRIHDVAEESIITPDEVSSTDFAVVRSLAKKRVRCPQTGCTYVGPLKEYEEKHELTCEYAVVACPNQCGESVHVTQIQTHVDTQCPLRRVICEYCQQEYLAKDEAEHLEKCELRPVVCDACNKEGLTKEELVYHQDNECPFFTCRLGCNQQRMPREEVGDHYRNLHHATEHMVHISRTLNELTRNIKSVQLSTKPDDDVVTNAHDDRVDDVLPQLELVQDQVKTLDNICSVYKVEFEKLNEAIYLNKQRSDFLHQAVNEVEDRIQVLEQAVQIRDVQLMERDLRLKALEDVSYDGTLIWRIDNFSECRRKAQNGEMTSMYSPAFYTSRFGYKMCARLYLNGDGIGKNSHVSFFFVVMRGKYDGLLRWPFQQKVTMILLDYNGQQHVMDAFRPDGGSASFHRPKNEMNVASGCPLFLTLSSLQEKMKNYVRDDVAYFKIVVDCSDITY